jgi:competence protein ComGC
MTGTSMQSPPPQGPPPPAQASPQRGGGLAIAALILGITGVIPLVGILLGLAAIILGIVSLAQGRPKKGAAIAGIATGAVLPWIAVMVSLLISILLPALGRSRELAQQVACGANLQGIAMGVEMYRTDHDGASPPDLNALVEAGWVSPDSLHCPSGRTKRGAYFYLPPGDDAAPTTLVACDRKGSHADGRNAASLDGTVQWLTEQEFQQLLAQPENAAFAQALQQAEGP